MLWTRSHSVSLLALVLISTAFVGEATATTVMLEPSKDNTIYQDGTSNSNGAGAGVYVGANRLLATRRGLMAFDLTAIPSGSTINSVTLELEVSMSHPVSSLVGLHRLNADWGEAGSSGAGSGAPAQVGDATWLRRFFNTVSWTSNGGDFVATASASQTVIGNGSYSWSGSGLVADVQAWVDTPSSNFGWLLKGDESTSQASKQIDSREGAVKPKLTIDYTPPVPALAGWGSWVLGMAMAGAAVLGLRRRSPIPKGPGLA